ncbi:MAG TPA: class I SAM-dependent methyltransferase [Bryobacteraceae bacterium]|nr:class I SAM-dependent methyltransferase [Bryobacteraceae bacterium]
MQVGVHEGHAIWSAVYDEAPNPLLDLEHRTVTPWLPPLAGRTLIDVACGTGRWTEYGAAQGARVFGADFCAPMLVRATAGRFARGRYVQADALRLCFADGRADLSLCAFAAGYLKSPRTMLAELARITAPGGRVMVTDIHPTALASGWRRSFRLGDRVYEINNRAHAISGYFSAARELGLVLEHFAEAFFGEPERAVFRSCGREASFEPMSRIPAIFAAMWRRS